MYRRGNTMFDIAYHFGVGTKGSLFRLRPVDMIGYHANNWKINCHSIGVCLFGNFAVDLPAQGQLDTLVELINELKGNGTVDTDCKILAHRDVSITGTACPGKFMYDQMNDVRDKIEQYE